MGISGDNCDSAQETSLYSQELAQTTSVVQQQKIISKLAQEITQEQVCIFTQQQQIMNKRAVVIALRIAELQHRIDIVLDDTIVNLRFVGEFAIVSWVYHNLNSVYFPIQYLWTDWEPLYLEHMREQKSIACHLRLGKEYEKRVARNS